MCKSREAKLLLERYHRLTEQSLVTLGLLQPGDCRAVGGAPRPLVAELSADLSKLFEDLIKKIGGSLSQNDQGGVEWDAQAVLTATAAMQESMRETLLSAVDDAVEAGLAHAADQLDIPQVAFDTIDQGILTQIKNQQISLSESTAAKVRGSVKEQLIESQRLGETMSQAMDRIRAISDLSEYQAERIARTELARAANKARLSGYKGRVGKVRWVLGPAYAGGCACAEMAREYPLAEADSAAMPLHPNCDCFWEPVL